MADDHVRAQARDFLTAERPSGYVRDMSGFTAIEAEQAQLAAETRALRAEVTALRRQIAQMASTLERMHLEHQRERQWTEQLERDLLVAVEDSRARDSVLFSALSEWQRGRRMWWRRSRKRRACA